MIGIKVNLITCFAMKIKDSESKRIKEHHFTAPLPLTMAQADG
jgi:hypothetical protein